MATLALFPAIVSCTAEESISDLTDRNTPETAPYSLATNENFRNDVSNMRQYTQDPEILSKIDTLEKTAVAEWLYEDSEIVRSSFETSLRVSQEEGTVPLYVLYNIPNRDLSSFSEGGASSGDNYLDWVKQVSNTIGDQSAVVIVEPDALAHTNEMDESAKNERIRLLASALDILEANERTAVYLDIANSHWLTPEQGASLLREVDEQSQAGIHGISLNVSNYYSEDDTRQFAIQLQEAFNRTLYVMIDNSRNGRPHGGNNDDWCNPEGQLLGNVDSLYDSDEAVETAFIKTPGESDGVCGISQKEAGHFDGQLFFDQLK